MTFFKGLVATVVAVSTLAAVIFAADNFIPSPVRRALPANASDIQEFHDFSGLQGDGVRLLKAKMPESEMSGFATRLGLNKRYVTNVPGPGKPVPFLFSGDNRVSWWNPPSNPSGAYFRDEPGKDKSEAIFYHDGSVYYEVCLW